MRYVFLAVCCLLLSACQSSKDAEEAAYWKKKYMTLKKFIDDQGMGHEANIALGETSGDIILVNKEGYLFNGEPFSKAEIKQITFKIQREEPVNVVVQEDTPHQALLDLLDGLNRNGIKSFNLINSKSK